MVSFETSFEVAAERKETNCQDLVSREERAGYATTLITLEMGSCRVPHLRTRLYKTSPRVSHLLTQTVKSLQRKSGSYHHFVSNLVRQKQNRPVKLLLSAVLLHVSLTIYMNSNEGLPSPPSPPLPRETLFGYCAVLPACALHC